MDSGGSSTALIFDDHSLSRAELNALVDLARSALVERGVVPGDRIAAMLPNGVHFFVYGYAAALAGCSVVPINWHVKQEELAWLLGDAAPKVFVVHSDFEAVAEKALAESPTPAVLMVGSGPVPDPGPSDRHGDGDELMPPTYVYYTSGTTGRPRGVERDGPLGDTRVIHAGLAATWGITGDDVWLASTPLYHAANAYSYTTLAQGGTVVIQDRWNAHEWMKLVERHRVTAAFMVPSHFIRLLEVPPEDRARYDLSSLKLILHAAAPCPIPVKWQALEALPSAQIWEFYGATEGGATRISPDEWRAHPGSVGTPWPGVEIRILDEEGGEVSQGEAGLIYIRPAGGAKFRYHNDPDKTDRAWRDDAFTVGDIGYLDADGYLYITDRASDMVIRAGVNIYPAEIEMVLHRHPLVVDCAVFGVADVVRGEELKALVETRGPIPPEELAGYLREHLADFKVPKYIELVAELPRDASGKVQKRLLRDAG